MQNVDLTSAPDPGAVTELLSGEFFAPSGAAPLINSGPRPVVVSPVLRGLFGF